MKKIEEEAVKLANIYLKAFRGKFRYSLFSAKNIKNNKWWSSFYKTASFFMNKKEWDAYGYISFIFDEYDKPLPFVLLYQKNWIAFVEHKESRTKNDTSIAKSLLTTYNEIKNWTKKNNYDTIAVYDFFSEPKNFMFLKRGKFSPYFLSISKSFMKKYLELSEEEQDEIINRQDLMVKRLTVMNNKKIANKLKEVLGEEFIGFKM